MPGQATDTAPPCLPTFYDDLVFPPPPPGRPYVAINMVSTVDGRTTLSREGKPVAERIGSPVDRTLMKRLRTHFDAVARGAETVRQSPYYPWAEPRETRQPLAVVFTRSGRLPVEASFFTGAPRPPLVVAPRLSGDRLKALRQAGAEVWETEDDLPAVLRRLGEEKAVRRLLLEGGPHLNRAFLAAGAVDELFLTLAPRLAGSGHNRRDAAGATTDTRKAGGNMLLNLSLVEGEPFWPPVELQLISVFRVESELFLRYRLSDPKAAH